MNIYLDAAATAKYRNTDDVIVNTITSAMRECWQNPSSLYASNVKNEINKCRENIAKFISAEPEEIYFTSGASESNNWVVRGWIDNVQDTYFNPVNIITTPIEHKSILEAVQNKALNANIYYCRVDEFGRVDYSNLEMLLKLLQLEPTLVTIGLGNNEIGTIQDIETISNLVHRYSGVVHVDATQAFGHIPVDVRRLGVDMMSVSGHKVSSVLKGIGFLYKKNHINIHPLIYGSQENGLRGGTENTFGIIGLSKALEYCDVRMSTVNNMYDKLYYFINGLISKFGCKLNGHNKFRLPNNVNVTFPQNITGESLLYTLDLSGIHISTGSACNSSEIEPSHVLKAIGLSDEEAMRTARFTLPEDITYEKIDFVVNEIEKSLKIIEM